MKTNRYFFAISAFALMMFVAGGCAAHPDKTVLVVRYHSMAAGAKIASLLQAQGLTNTVTVAGSETGAVTAAGSEAAKVRTIIAQAIKHDGLDAEVVNQGGPGGVSSREAVGKLPEPEKLRSYLTYDAFGGSAEADSMVGNGVFTQALAGANGRPVEP